ncbi:MAG: hypothetical protein R3261_01895 [Alphaproteobacteria bacterium]|nr:hypothetical protein [Alphaproteobacteria bacterium]
MEFNRGNVDGELFRLTLIEERYTTDFVRSSTALILLTNSLFTRPDIDAFDTRHPIGFQSGVAWQEDFVKGKPSLLFYTANQMFKAYANKKLDVFLAAPFEVRQYNDIYPLSPLPIEAEVISKLPLYHYLSSDFAPFMEKLDAYLSSNQPFRDF